MAKRKKAKKRVQYRESRRQCNSCNGSGTRMIPCVDPYMHCGSCMGAGYIVEKERV